MRLPCPGRGGSRAGAPSPGRGTPGTLSGGWRQDLSFLLSSAGLGPSHPRPRWGRGPCFRCSSPCSLLPAEGARTLGPLSLRLGAAALLPGVAWGRLRYGGWGVQQGHWTGVLGGWEALTDPEGRVGAQARGWQGRSPFTGRGARVPDCPSCVRSAPSPSSWRPGTGTTRPPRMVSSRRRGQGGWWQRRPQGRPPSCRGGCGWEEAPVLGGAPTRGLGALCPFSPRLPGALPRW